MKGALHFVGFRCPQREADAVRVFGPPDFVHRNWDTRAAAEIMAGDTAVFAKGDARTPPSVFSFDDSAHV